jgi:hypothetical protein
MKNQLGRVEKMSQGDFDAQVQEWIGEEYEKLWAEPMTPLDEATIHRIAQAGVTERVRAEMERNPAFKEALLNRCAQQWAQERSNAYVEEHRPNGNYGADRILTLDHKNLVKMCDATRAYVVQWARHETEPRNLQYIVSRLAVWDGTKHRTLADLEKDIALTSVKKREMVEPSKNGKKSTFDRRR